MLSPPLYSFIANPLPPNHFQNISPFHSTLGAGSFSLPHAFLTGGLWGSAVGTLLLGGLAAWTFTVIADAEKYCVAKDPAKRRLTYPQVL